MKIIDVEQGSPEWWEARLGIPTASEFSKILTPVKLDPSTSATGYMHKLIAEQLRGKADESFQSEWMKRGNELEPEAADYYAMLKDCEPQKVGFCIEDGGRYGCSPDRLVGDGGGLEIKCVSPGVQVGYLLKGELPADYRLQVFGALLITGRAWWDFISYHPDLEPLIIRVKRSDVTQELDVLEKALLKFSQKLQTNLFNLTKKAAA